MKADTLKLIFWLFMIAKICLAQQRPPDSLYALSTNDNVNFVARNANVIHDSTNRDPKLSFAPIIAFGLLGSLVGAGIGGLIDPPHDVPEGEPAYVFSKGITIGWIAGAATGAYIGYRLAKRDLEREKSKTTKTNE